MTPHPSRLQQLKQLIEKLGLSEHSPVNWELLDQALTHPTASNSENYERLEFVGDAVIKLAAAQCLFETYPQSDEGELAAIRSVLVSDRTLAQLADCYGLDRYLQMSSSTQGDQVGRETRLAAAFEAVLAALFLSTQSLSLIRPWLDSHLNQTAIQIRSDPTLQNYKGALQAWTQAHHQTLPEYRVTEVGQTYGDRERFVAEVWLNGQQWGEGKGQSKKAAEQAAAKAAFLALQHQS